MAERVGFAPTLSAVVFSMSYGNLLMAAQFAELKVRLQTVQTQENQREHKRQKACLDVVLQGSQDE
jgi:hypothetical protein